MFTDMATSRDLLERFKNYLEDSSQTTSVGLDFNVLVLATGSWPLQPPSTNFTIPKDLVACEQLFVKFYQMQHSGRKLNWLHQLSKGELRARYGKKYSFVTSTYQMGILLQFNSNDKMSTDDLQIATQLTQNTLVNTLATLVKTKVVKMEPAPPPDEEIPKIEHESTFTINENFRSKKQKVNINIPLRREKEEENEEMHKAVEEDRKLQIQAAIVRIMKMRKRLQHTALMTEVISQLQTRFKPSVGVIKKCIDILIEKEYLERVEGQKDMYSYVA